MAMAIPLSLASASDVNRTCRNLEDPGKCLDDDLTKALAYSSITSQSHCQMVKTVARFSGQACPRGRIGIRQRE